MPTGALGLTLGPLSRTIRCRRTNWNEKGHAEPGRETVRSALQVRGRGECENPGTVAGQSDTGMASLAEEGPAQRGVLGMMIVPIREFVIPGGEVKYQCTRCWGVYNTKEQAENIGQPGNGRNRCHRCRAGPFRE